MNPSNKFGWLRPDNISNKISITNYLYEVIKKGKSNKDYNELRNIMTIVYDKIFEKLLEGEDYKIPRLGIIHIRMNRRPNTKQKVKFKPYFDEVHAELLDCRVNCTLKRSSFKFLKDTKRICFKPTSNVVDGMMDRVVNKGYKNIYLYDK